VKKICVLTVFVLALGLMSAAVSGAATVNYGQVTLNGGDSQNFDNLWDLTQGDLTLAYTLDLSGIISAGWSVTQVGLRQLGSSNIDPNLTGGWLQSNYVNSASRPDDQDLNDMHLLSKHGWSYQEYDAEDAETLVTPYWSDDNYGFWFDRDGVDQWQADQWGMAGTYDTGGVYQVVITYHAIDGQTGTMFATINGVQQGLYIGGWKDAQPEFYPAGRSFSGDMGQMQVFCGRGGGGGTVIVSDLEAQGSLRLVSIGGCQTGILDQDYQGRLISEWIDDCAQKAKNHGQFVSCVTGLSQDLLEAGLITGPEKDALDLCAAQADFPPEEPGGEEPGLTVVIDGCDTGVLDQDYHGRLISEWIDDCAASAGNHGQFVSCVAQLTNDLKKEGLITGAQKGAIQSCAARANLPFDQTSDDAVDGTETEEDDGTGDGKKPKKPKR